MPSVASARLQRKYGAIGASLDEICGLMSGPVRVGIELSALEANLARLRALAPGCRVLAVIKGDAYGHGLLDAARALADADGFGVCRLDEALALREAGLRQAILLLQGCNTAAELRTAARNRLDVTVHREDQLHMLEREDLERAVRIWLKIDTGMHRLGLPPERATPAWERLRAAPAVAPAPILMTHLAAADHKRDPLTGEQLGRFAVCCDGLKADRSIANSAALLHLPQCRTGWIRPGLALYGASPLASDTGARHGLRPAMSLRSELIAVHRLQAGARVGYGAAWRCPEDMPVGIAAIGYGDGYPRHAPSGTPVLVNGCRAGLIAPPSMDMLALDLRACPAAAVGDPVVLWSKELPVEEIAAHVGTIPHQLLRAVRSRSRIVMRGEDERTSPSRSAGASGP